MAEFAEVVSADGTVWILRAPRRAGAQDVSVGHVAPPILPPRRRWARWLLVTCCLLSFRVDTLACGPGICTIAAVVTGASHAMTTALSVATAATIAANRYVHATKRPPQRVTTYSRVKRRFRDWWYGPTAHA